MKKTTLILGCGDIGTQLGKQLIAAGHRVIGARRNAGALEGTGIEPVALDVTDDAALAALPDADFVVYAVTADRFEESAYAAAYPEGLKAVVAQFAQRETPPKRLFFVSSTSVYAQQGGEEVDETSPTEPNGFSGTLMREAEQALLDHTLPGTVVRLSGIYGPGRDRLIRQVKEGRIAAANPPMNSNNPNNPHALMSVLNRDQYGDRPLLFGAYYSAPPEGYKEKHFYYLDEDGKYCGMISRRNIINLRKRRIILVDHNEATQAVEGFDQAEILEIIDHHRIGSLETSGPVYFRNQPVGCTATIVTQMYDENGVTIPQKIAGLLLAAILSDTLVFRSPTCTPIDVNAANRLAKIAGVDINEFANEMFEAGEKLDGKTAEEVFLQDFKVFMCGDIRFGVAQGSYMTRKNLTAAEALLKPYLEEARNKQNVEDIYMLLTDVPKEESVVICNGRYAAEVLTDGFDTQPAADASWTLPGVVSRKKQFIPALMTAYQEL